MLNVQNGQCGLCTHFGEEHAADQKLVQIRTSHTADASFVDACGLPKHASLNLKVTPISSCSGFEAARMN